MAHVKDAYDRTVQIRRAHSAPRRVTNRRKTKTKSGNVLMAASPGHPGEAAPCAFVGTGRPGYCLKIGHDACYLSDDHSSAIAG